eukprot:11680909-Karenia_brevis.AAC.1
MANEQGTNGHDHEGNDEDADGEAHCDDHEKGLSGERTGLERDDEFIRKIKDPYPPRKQSRYIF